MKISFELELDFAKVDVMEFTSVTAFCSVCKGDFLYHLFHGWLRDTEVVFIEKKSFPSGEVENFVTEIDVLRMPVFAPLGGSAILDVISSILKRNEL